MASSSVPTHSCLVGASHLLLSNTKPPLASTLTLYALPPSSSAVSDDTTSLDHILPLVKPMADSDAFLMLLRESYTLQASAQQPWLAEGGTETSVGSSSSAQLTVGRGGEGQVNPGGMNQAEQGGGRGSLGSKTGKGYVCVCIIAFATEALH